MHCDPVEIVCAVRAGRRPVAGKAGQLLFRGEGAEEEIIGAGWSITVEQLERDLDFSSAEDTGRHDYIANTIAIPWCHIADEDSPRLRDRLDFRRRTSERDHVDTARSFSIPESRSERCHSSGSVEIF